MIFTQRPEWPALWHSVTFLAPWALSLPVVGSAPVVAVVAAVVAVASFFPLPWPSSASANDAHAPATNRARANALSFTVFPFGVSGCVGIRDAVPKGNRRPAGRS